MLATNLPGAIVLADKDASRQVVLQSTTFGGRIDFGRWFPVPSAQGDSELVACRPNQPFREPLSSSPGILGNRSASFAGFHVFLTKSEVEPELELLQTIRKYNKKAEIIRCVHKPKFFKEINGEQIKPLDLLRRHMWGCSVELLLRAVSSN